ncbi:MAG: DUF1837 domain-containing protein [Alphaproteobacteria bacterium]|nr:DUF1837 domain-containing protein [Alphaproteobacteria bacterium]
MVDIPLFNFIFWFKQKFDIKPDKEHIGCSITYTDIKERRDDFFNELMATVLEWVYSSEKYDELLKKRLGENNNVQNATAYIANLANSKFRPLKPQGQFGELILFNCLRYFFCADPLLRKQPITTSVGMERYGADAIHYKKDSERNLFFLGESKCYESKYKFKDAFEDAVQSIIKTFNNLENELNLYVYDGMIQKSLTDIAEAYKNNTLQKVEHELVCLIIYNENKKIDGQIEEDLKKSIQKIIEERFSSIDEDIFKLIDEKILNRINYGSSSTCVGGFATFFC